MSYTIDVYRGRMRSETGLLAFAAYVALFPQLVAGPIVRAAHLLPQLAVDHRWSGRRFLRGLELIVWGYVLKVCLADNLAALVDPRFAEPAAYGAGQLAVGTAGFAFQIYGDFAGYSLIAIGLGRIMGLHFPANFNRPYFARDFSEFWQRWHISLSSWIRDYLYIPLGGNRGSRARTSRNLILTMGLGGLWHGANWTFVIWGLLHGLYLFVQHALQRVVPEGWRARPRAAALAAPAKIALTFLLVCLAWVFFRADDMDDALTILGRLAELAPDRPIADAARFIELKALFFVAVVLLFDALTRRRSVLRRIAANRHVRVSLTAANIWLILLLGNFDTRAFIYFQF